LKLRTLLLLGRTSNLPTVWTNVLCGAVLSGTEPHPAQLALLVACGSAFYEGGMFLNDAFDADIDARERPTRPIPAGVVARSTVFQLGFGLLALGLVLLVVASLVGLTLAGWAATLAGAGTAACILIYNRWHKGHAWSPIAMGACRAGLYLTAAYAVAGIAHRDVLYGAVALLLYVVGLTHIARFETGKALDRAWLMAFVFSPLVLAVPRVISQRSWLGAIGCLLLAGWAVRSLGYARRGGRMIGRAVVTLLHGNVPLAVCALGCFLLTLRWQKHIPGT
jgi:4-hydroxybenzoate polyprenyltransferase